MSVNPESVTECEAELSRILKTLSVVQLRYIVARSESKTDREAAETIGTTASAVKSWDNKSDVDDAVRLFAYDGVLTARELRRRNLAKAMAIKVSGLDSDDERMRQSVATEIIEGELGKAKQQTDITSAGENIFASAKAILEKVYGR